MAWYAILSSYASLNQLSSAAVMLSLKASQAKLVGSYDCLRSALQDIENQQSSPCRVWMGPHIDCSLLMPLDGILKKQLVHLHY